MGNGTSYEFLSTMLLTMYCYSADNKCSCFAFKDKDNIMFGRNSDFLVSLEKKYMNTLYNLDGCFAFNGNTTAFIEMEDGINEHGLAIGITFVASEKIKPGLNAGMLTRYILEKCNSVDEAISFLKEVPIASAQTLTIADRYGKLVVVECNCDKVVIIGENNNFVSATNIFVSDNMKKYNITDFDNWRAEERYETLTNALTNNKYNLDFAINLLSEKYGFICKYDRRKNADTVWSTIYDILNKKIYRVEGNPSRKKFIEDKRMKFKY